MPGTPANSPRLAIPRFSNADTADFAADANSVVDAIDAAAGGYLSGTDAGKGSASSSNAGKFYLATDSGAFYYSDGSAWHSIVGARGAASITGTESRTNTGYGTLPTPDQVQNIVLPTNGQIEIGYQAMWQESVAGAARAAIFIGSNQLKTQFDDTPRGPAPEAAATNAGSAAINLPLFTTPVGLASAKSSAGFSADVTTGQTVGFVGAAATLVNDSGALFGVVNALLGGSCRVFAAAGTYTVSVQFKASSGSVTASSRKLWVRVLSSS